ncbi:hypothetical protein [Nostoc sp.]|uniref:hypothetical protein n=1 Tax=Nostoc sp. TaxID=1180 RepID=UPI002FFB7888
MAKVTNEFAEAANAIAEAANAIAEAANAMRKRSQPSLRDALRTPSLLLIPNSSPEFANE